MASITKFLILVLLFGCPEYVKGLEKCFGKTSQTLFLWCYKRTLFDVLLLYKNIS